MIDGTYTVYAQLIHC